MVSIMLTGAISLRVKFTLCIGSVAVCLCFYDDSRSPISFPHSLHSFHFFSTFIFISRANRSRSVARSENKANEIHRFTQINIKFY